MAKKTRAPSVLSRKEVRWAAIAAIALAIVAVGILAFWLLSEQDAFVEGDVLATVNGEPIYTEEISALHARLPPDLQAQVTREDLIQQAIDKELVLQRARSEGIRASDEEVEARIAEQAQMFGSSASELRQLLEASGVSWSDYEDAVREEVVLTRFVEEEIIPQVDIAPDDVEEYYYDNPDLFEADAGEIRVRHILVGDEELAVELSDRARAGEDFAALAREHSLDSTAASGGLLGFVSAETPLVEPFLTAALALEEGEVSVPVETQYGWHVIKREGNVVGLEEAEPQIRQALEQAMARQRFDELLVELRGTAEIRRFDEG